MNSITFVCFVGLFGLAVCRPEEQYTDKFDNINVNEILANARLLQPYIKCTLGEGKCSPEAKELKGHIADALETDCSKCTDKQKTEIRKVIKHLINHEEESWNQLTAKYDPTKKYVTKYEKELKNAKA